MNSWDNIVFSKIKNKKDIVNSKREANHQTPDVKLSKKNHLSLSLKVQFSGQEVVSARSTRGTKLMWCRIPERTKFKKSIEEINKENGVSSTINSLRSSYTFARDKMTELEKYTDYVGYYFRQAYVDAAKAMNIKITQIESDHPKILPQISETIEDQNKKFVRFSVEQICMQHEIVAQQSIQDVRNNMASLGLNISNLIWVPTVSINSWTIK